jgi:hypothetical protein
MKLNHGVVLSATRPAIWAVIRMAAAWSMGRGGDIPDGHGAVLPSSGDVGVSRGLQSVLRLGIRHRVELRSVDGVGRVWRVAVGYASWWGPWGYRPYYPPYCHRIIPVTVR